MFSTTVNMALSYQHGAEYGPLAPSLIFGTLESGKSICMLDSLSKNRQQSVLTSLVIVTCLFLPAPDPLPAQVIPPPRNPPGPLSGRSPSSSLKPYDRRSSVQSGLGTDITGRPQLKDVCAVCGSRDTPEWRRGPSGLRTLCNGCGLLSAKRRKERGQRGQYLVALVRALTPASSARR